MKLKDDGREEKFTISLLTQAQIWLQQNRKNMIYSCMQMLLIFHKKQNGFLIGVMPLKILRENV